MNRYGIIFCAVLVLGLSPTARAELVGGTVYDPDRDIYWLVNANLAATQTFGVSGIEADGRMNWDMAQAWIAGMNAYDGGTGWLGFNNWRLPTALSADGSGPCGEAFNCNDSEMGHLFYDELGGHADRSISSTSGVDNFFNNVQSNVYWSGTGAANPGNAWYFNTVDGRQDFMNKYGNGYTWAVRSGDV